MRYVCFSLFLAIPLFVALLLSPAARPAQSAATEQVWRYTALGDSLALGAGAERGYVARYAEHLAQDHEAVVELGNLAMIGLLSVELRYALRDDPALRAAVQSSAVVTWNVGGNDLLVARLLYKRKLCGGADNQWCLRAFATRLKANWTAIAQEITALAGARGALLRTMDLYNPYITEDLVDGSFGVFKPYLDDVNAHIAESAVTHGYRYARVYDAFNGPNHDEAPEIKGYLAADGFHPNGAGHEVIATLLRELGRASHAIYLPVALRSVVRSGAPRTASSPNSARTRSASSAISR